MILIFTLIKIFLGEVKLALVKELSIKLEYFRFFTFNRHFLPAMPSQLPFVIGFCVGYFVIPVFIFFYVIRNICFLAIHSKRIL